MRFLRDDVAELTALIGCYREALTATTLDTLTQTKATVRAAEDHADFAYLLEQLPEALTLSIDRRLSRPSPAPSPRPNPRILKAFPLS